MPANINNTQYQMLKKKEYSLCSDSSTLPLIELPGDCARTKLCLFNNSKCHKRVMEFSDTTTHIGY